LLTCCCFLSEEPSDDTIREKTGLYFYSQQNDEFKLSYNLLDGFKVIETKKRNPRFQKKTTYTVNQETLKAQELYLVQQRARLQAELAQIDFMLASIRQQEESLRTSDAKPIKVILQLEDIGIKK